MKIRCDVCDNAVASVFCSADEAALCDGCDHRVHHANKLASKHLRFFLQHPSSKECPICDICKERRALLFCQDDRAILCSECDIPIHKANEHTQKHNRFLLTGVKLSAYSSYPISSYNTSEASNKRHQPSMKRPTTVLSNETFITPSLGTPSPPSMACNVDDNLILDSGSISTSSISEYLETVPGWHVDDFLDPSYATNSFCEVWSATYS